MLRAEIVRYRLYGRIVASSFPLPELSRVTEGEAAFVVRVSEHSLQGPPVWPHSVVADQGDEWMAVAAVEGALWFRFLGVALARCQRNSSGTWEIEFDRASRLPDETTRHFLIDEAIPVMLASTGSSVLHGAAVVVDTGALVILGGSGIGKTTLGVTLARQSHPLLSDDCVVIDHEPTGFVVQPSYPSVRAWADGARHLFGDDRVGFPFAHYTNKRRYGEGLHFVEKNAPLLGVVALENSPAEDPSLIQLTDLTGHAACAAVLGGTKSMPIDSRKPMAVHALIDLATQVPVARLVLPRDLARLPAACDALLRWAATT